LSAITKVNLIVPIVPGGYHLLKSQYKVTAGLFHMNYVNPIFLAPQASEAVGHNILLGNSSSYTNNHIEAIDQIANLDLQDRRVIIPLNYGDKDYGLFVKSYAYKTLGKN